MKDLHAEPPHQTIIQRVSVAQRLAEIRVCLVGRVDSLSPNSSRRGLGQKS